MLIFFPRLADIVVLDLASARRLYSYERSDFAGRAGKITNIHSRVGVVNCIMNIKYAAFLLYLTGTILKCGTHKLFKVVVHLVNIQHPRNVCFINN